MSASLLSPPQLLRHAAELVRLLLKSPQPPRLLTSQYLHDKKKLTPDAKAAISSLAFHTLRHLRLARYLADGGTGEIRSLDTRTASACTAAALYLDVVRAVYDGAALDDALHGIAEAVVQEAGLDITDLRTRMEELATLHPGRDGLHWALFRSVPGWIMEMWLREQRVRTTYPRPEALASGLLHPAPLTLRVNTARARSEEVLTSLLDAGIQARAHPLLPHALVLDRREQLLGSEWEAKGLIEIQDAGSQLIGHALAPLRGWDVLDACAGAGGKTLQLTDALSGSGSITAADVERMRLTALRLRAERLGQKDLEIRAVPPKGDLAEIFQRRQFDAVVVDAPCSGFGTARRNPLVKWKLQPKSLNKLAEKQFDILLRNAALVKPGGVLLYATCSLLPTENEHVVERFLRHADDFTPAPLAEALTGMLQKSVLSDPDQSMLTLDPALLDSDGFFIARLRRRR
ncbi:MAG: class I SAM-dependent methyltransferase [Bacteroidia bacterium]|nr:class I SAM-dependent methyltransferase [Bacteroidia bacterium]